MNNRWNYESTNYTICDLAHKRYIKCYYDDGCLYDVTWCDNPLDSTLFMTNEEAKNCLCELEEDNFIPKNLVKCIVEVKTVNEVSI